MPIRLSVVVTNYNGCHFLREYLGSVVDAVSSRPEVVEVLVADDASTDDSVPFIRRRYPSIRILVSPVNLGFSSNVNFAISYCVGDVVVLLNNDLHVEKGFVEPLLEYFSDDKVFAVCMKSHLIRNKNLDETLVWGKYKRGFIYGMHPGMLPEYVEPSQVCTNFLACGGCSAFDRRKWLELGGFDQLYHPFFWEDTDISYRAWKRGWLVLYQPHSRVYHWKHGTFERTESTENIMTIVWRNQYLFFWKNITDWTLIVRHLVWLSVLIPASVFLMSQDRWRFIWKGFICALPLLPQVLKRRRALRSTPHRLTDRAILLKSANQFYSGEPRHHGD